MNTETVFDIEIYGPKSNARDAMDLIIRSLNGEIKFYNEDIWKSNPSGPILVKYLETCDEGLSSYEKLWERVVDFESSDSEFGYAFPNLVLIGNSYNSNWIKGITRLIPEITINVTECSEILGLTSYRVTEYRATNGNFDFYRFDPNEEPLLQDNYEISGLSLISNNIDGSDLVIFD